MGVMLLEIICCRRCSDFQTEDEEEAILPDWLMIAIEVTNRICLWRLMMRQELTWGGLERLVVVAIWCIQEDPSLRPSMRIVKLMLEGMVDVSAPPCTFPFSSDYWNCPQFQMQIMCPCFHCCAFQHSQPENDEEVILTDWAYDCYRGHRLDKLVKNDDETRNEMAMMEWMVMVALWCIQEDPSSMPYMGMVILMLERVVEAPVPPCPFPFSSTFWNYTSLRQCICTYSFL